ncbi:MAG: ATP-binding protein [Acidobacteriota bacterium]
MKEEPRAPDILVVDDTPANLDLLAAMLRGKGYKVRPVPAGRLALRAAASSPPDLILLDINMPDMSGYEVCRRLKSDDRLKDIPVIFISALQEAMDKVSAFSSGGVDYVTKPFQFEEVEARVGTHLRIRRLQSELQEQNSRLEASLTELRKLEELRNNLTDMIVHDMRSPLTGLTGFLDLCLDASDLSEKAKNWLNAAKEAATVLMEMANTLLDVSRMEAGEMPLALASCDLRGLAELAVDSMRIMAEQKDIAVRIIGESVALPCDQDLIRRVILNLLQNALKYTPRRGAVEIVLSRTAEGASVKVSDTGCGIPPEYHEKIFEKFGQVAARKARHSSGLGLAFCRLAVQAHNGQIGVVSEPGKGSTFWFTLPA